MNEIRQQDGASVNARQQMPSTDLTGLINFLVDAFPADKNQPQKPFGWDVLKFDADKKRLSINTYGILRRFLANKKMREDFRKTDSTGFLRDLLSPPKNFTAKMGGRLFDEIGLSQSVIKLKRLIAAEIEQLGISADNILVTDPVSALQILAKQTGSKDFFQEVPVKMVAMEFAKSEQLIARVFSATEEIQAEDWLKRLSDSMVAMQSEHDDEFDDIDRDKLIETLKQDFDKPDSQVTRFLNFLEDEALARVRLQVGFAIMDSLSAQISQPEQPDYQRFIQYIQKVIRLFEHFALPESLHSLHINLARDYGLNAEFSMTEQLVKASFYNCLPVWAECNTQLFESHSTDTLTKGVSIIRDVSYRFRVNGKNPSDEKLLAFDARLESLRETLIDSPEVKFPRKPLSEVVFLWLVLNPAINVDNLSLNAQRLSERLNSKEHIVRLLSDLSSWSADVKGLSSTLIKLLRDKSRPAIDRAQKSVHDLFLVVEQGVVNSSAIERSRGKASEPFKPGESNELIEWFKYIKITDKPDEVSDCLFSIQVRTRLHDRTLTMQEVGDLAPLKVIRQPSEKLLNITWRPLHVDERQSPIKREPRTKIDSAWLMGAGVDIWYDPEKLKYRNNQKILEEDQRQYRAAATTAMAVVVYVILQVLTEKINKELDVPLTALMLRFQTQGKQAADNEGDHLVYALSHAIETALMRDIPVRMQGLVADHNNRTYKDRGAAHALSAAFPLIISAPSQPAVNKVAVIVYATRPCDEHSNPDIQTGFTFQAKIYLADAVSQPLTGYRLAFNRMQTHVVENSDAFKSPQLIMEEIGRLHDLGYEHILLISNDCGNRRLNRSAQRHSPHTQTDFLSKVSTKFADVRLYMLRRDVFPATRLFKKTKGESAFEATSLAVHDEFNSGSATKELRAIYTFATLVAIDEASRPQSGFCTYFLDTDYRVKNTQWSEQIRADLLLNTDGTRDCLLQVLRGLHFLEAEKQPDGNVFKPVLDPFTWVNPKTKGAVGEIEALPSSRRSGKVLLSLPALLSHVTEALHNGRE